MRYPQIDRRELLRSLVNYIDKERAYRIPTLTAADAAEAIGVARSTLLKVLKEERGLTFSQYLDKSRIHHARHHIQQNNSKHTVEHIAMLCGYGSAATLTRKYRGEYGESPYDTMRNKRRGDKQ